MLEQLDVDLPVRSSLPAICAAVRDHGRVVVSAPPGTGKTTLVPPALADLVEGRIVVAQPRRIAARAAAARLAHLLGEPVGQTVGYSVRGDSQTSSSTRVEFVTAGLLVQRILANPDMVGVGAVVMDEVHERSLDSDLLAALMLDVADLTDIRLVAMSATLAAEQWPAHLGGAPIVTSEAALFDVERVYAPGPAPLGPRGVTREFLAHIADLADSPEKTLVFVPGRKEISQLQELLPGARALHGSVPAREQDEILAGQGHIILATSIAESSLTVPGIHRVVDSGLARRPFMDVRHGIGGLTTQYASRAAMTQRAGRAGRLGPGTAILAMSQVSFARANAADEPEILTSDITSFVLSALCWSSINELRLLDRPSDLAIERAMDLLAGLGAVDGGVTDLGRRLSRFPADPRHARALLDAAPRMGSAMASEIVALLDEGSGDLGSAWVAMKRNPTRTWKHTARRLEKLIDPVPPTGMDRDEAIGIVVSAAYPDRIAMKRGDSYLCAGGVGAALPPGSPLAGAELLAVGEMTRGEAHAIIRSAIPISKDLLDERAQVETTYEVDGKVKARDVRRVGVLELGSSPATIDPAQARTVLEQWLARAEFPDSWWSDNSRHLRDRLTFLHDQLGEPWPSVTDDDLARPEFFGPDLDRWAQGKSLTASMSEVLQRVLPWPEAVRLDELAPPTIASPAGGSVQIHYGQRPWIKLKLQECFGWTDTPEICGVPLVIHLLSPAGRDLAVTADLASFWAGPYAGVRADMRGRYPKHPWPEDGANATPTKKTKGRS